MTKEKSWVNFILEFVLTLFLARNKGERYVYNVIATDIAVKKVEKKKGKKTNTPIKKTEYYVVVQHK